MKLYGEAIIRIVVDRIVSAKKFTRLYVLLMLCGKADYNDASVSCSNRAIYAIFRLDTWPTAGKFKPGCFRDMQAVYTWQERDG